jgi:hypothetical protein
MIARPALMALMVDDPNNTTEDIQLSIACIRRGIPIGNVEDATLKTIYPSSLRECLARRAKHARGLAFAQGLWTRREWRRLGMRGPMELALAAFVRIWEMRLPLPELALALALRLSFALFWGYYLLALRRRECAGMRCKTTERTR